MSSMPANGWTLLGLQTKPYCQSICLLESLLYVGILKQFLGPNKPLPSTVHVDLFAIQRTLFRIGHISMLADVHKDTSIRIALYSSLPKFQVSWDMFTHLQTIVERQTRLDF